MTGDLPHLTEQDEADIDAVCDAVARVARYREAMTGARMERSDVLRSMRARGWGLGELAEVFGVSKSRMQQLCGRRP
jgi:hypothetical protein